MSGQGSRAASALDLLPSCTLVRGIGILGSSHTRSWIKPRNTPSRWPSASPIHARGGRYYLRLDAYARSWMLAKLPMLIAVRGIQPGKRDPVEPPCGRCSSVGVRLQASGPYEILQATVEIVRGSVHAEALGRCHRVHATACRTACRGVPQLPSHRLQQVHGLGAHVTSRTSYATRSCLYWGVQSFYTPIDSASSSVSSSCFWCQRFPTSSFVPQ